MVLIDIQEICLAETHIHVISLQLEKGATRNLLKFYPLGAGKSSRIGTGGSSSKAIVGNLARIAWVRIKPTSRFHTFVYDLTTHNQKTNLLIYILIGRRQAEGWNGIENNSEISSKNMRLETQSHGNVDGKILFL